MISVIFSTYNGGADLSKMLDGLTRLLPPPGGWELLAVDNASTDRSGDVLRSYADRLPINVLTESGKGKNRALNRAIDVARGDFYVFTDDDVLVQEDWLVRWREVADAQPSFEMFAGLTRPRFPHEPPPWLLQGIDAGVVFAAHSSDMKEGPSNVVYMFGTNMAVRASVFQAGVRFSTTIGPDGSANYAMGSDTELARRLERQGLKCWFASGAIVEHIVPPEHLDPKWILRRAYRWGRGQARMGFSSHCPPDILARKNNLKMAVYPVFLPFLGREERWRRQWQCMVDRGFEDGTRDESGQKARWA